MAKEKLRTTLPKQIYVRWEGKAGDQFLNSTETIAGIEDGEKVGIYKLVEMKTMKVTEDLV